MNPRVAHRLGLGPVFVYEWLTASRRWQAFAQRSLFVLLLLVALALNWLQPDAARNAVTLSGLASVGQSFFLSVIGTQLVLVLLAAPAATAGAICIDPARGMLTHLLVTDLSNSEIVLGKLAVRLVPVMALVACALPMMELLTLLGGVDPDALLGAFIVTSGVAVLGCSLAFFFSLWAGKTHEALVSTYTVWGLWLLGPIMIPPLNRALGVTLPVPPRTADPFSLAFAPYWWPGTVDWSDYFWFLVVTCSISLLVVTMAVWRIRSASTRDTTRGGPSRFSRSRAACLLKRFDLAGYLSTPFLDKNPVLWREWHRNRPSWWARIVTSIYVTLAVVFSLVAILSPHSGYAVAPLVNAFQLSVGLLLLSVSAVTSLAEDRLGGSLDVLMTTPLHTRQIVVGKWLGTFRKVPLLAILPACVALFTDGETGFLRTREVLLLIAFVLCSGGAITSLGLAMATRFSRLSRALGATVSIYVLIVAGWLFLILTLTGGPGGFGLMIGSPFAWAFFSTAQIQGHQIEQWPGWAIVWIFAYAFGAVVLFVATLADFNLRMGRAGGQPSALGRFRSARVPDRANVGVG